MNHASLETEFLQLIQDTRQFIQGKLRKVRSEAQQSPPEILPPALRLPAAAAAAAAPTIRAPEPLLKEIPPPAVEKKVLPKKEMKVSGWELQTMGHVAGDLSFYHKLSQYTRVCEPLLIALLVLTEDEPSHRLFLENVARAITKTFGAAASVVPYQDALFLSGTPLILAPLSLVRKKVPTAQAHQILKYEGSSLIPLEEIELYGQDAQSKRALWNAIQLTLQS